MRSKIAMIAIQEWSDRPTSFPLYGLKHYFCFVFVVFTSFVFWSAKLNSSTLAHRNFGGNQEIACFLPVSCLAYSSILQMKQQVYPKRRWTSMGLEGPTFRKIVGETAAICYKFFVIFLLSDYCMYENTTDAQC
jgi:hypothetical protein